MFRSPFENHVCSLRFCLGKLSIVVSMKATGAFAGKRLADANRHNAPNSNNCGSKSEKKGQSHSHIDTVPLWPVPGQTLHIQAAGEKGARK
jgi:hypothetical protein